MSPLLRDSLQRVLLLDLGGGGGGGGWVRYCVYEYIFNEIFQTLVNFYRQCKYNTGPGVRAVYSVGLRLLACSDCTFESCLGH